MEGRFRFVPLDTRVLNPKVGVPAPTQLVILPTARNWQPKVELLILLSDQPTRLFPLQKSSPKALQDELIRQGRMSSFDLPASSSTPTG